MKNSLYLTFAAAAFMAVSCNEDFSDWAAPQSSEEGAASVVAGTVSSASSSINGGSVSGPVAILNTSTAEGNSIVLSHLCLNGTEVAYTMDGNNVCVDSIILADVVRDTYKSLAPVARDVEVTAKYAMKNSVGESFPINVDPVKFSYTPAALPANAKESAYYYIGGYNGWNLAEPTKFEDKGNGIYELNITIGDGEWFAFAPQSAVDAQDWNALFRAPSNGCTDKFGYLNNDPTTGWSFNCEAGGSYTFTLDMNNYTFNYHYEVAEAYYIVGGPNDWAGSAASKQLKFSHSSISVYDDPVFTITFPASEGDTWFAIGDDKACDAITNDGNWSLLFGTTSGNGNNGTSGTLSRRSSLTDDGSFCVSGGSKFIKVTINMVESTYLIETVNYEPAIYFIGATDGWSVADQTLVLTDQESGTYSGFLYCADPNGWGNEFKFQKESGNWDTQINAANFIGFEGSAVNKGDNIGIDGPEGVYFFQVSLGSGIITATPITNMNLVGDFNGWNAADDAQQMTWNAADFCYEITGAGVTSNGWKFTANNAWDINLGGNVDNLVANGDNLSAVGSTIKLYPCRKGNNNIYCTVE